MGEQDQKSSIWAARRQINSLHDAGYEAYINGQLAHAAELYKSALAIAEAINDSYTIISSRFWYGIGLYFGGELRQALAVWTPILQDNREAADAADVFNTICYYIEVAKCLPTSLKTIEKADAQAENFLRDTGHSNWRHLLLYLRAELLKLRGMYTEALAAAQESWATWIREYPNNTADTHLESLVDISLRLRRPELARRYLAEWEHHWDNTIPKERIIQISYRQSILARFENRADDAVEWARRAMPIAGLIDHEANRLTAVIVMARAFLCNGEVEHARNLLARLFALRHSEYGHHRYELRLLRGDFHLACARSTAGMLPRDDEFGEDFPPPTLKKPKDAQAATRALRRARRAYDEALKVGQWIDGQLQCSLRQQAIARRFERIEAIERHFA